MKSTMLVLAAIQLATPVEEVNHQYIDRQTKEAIERMESSVCGMQSGMYGEVSNPIEYERPKNMPKNCKVKLPEKTQ